MWTEDADRLISRARAAAATSNVVSVLAKHLDLGPDERRAALERLADIGDERERRAAMEAQNQPSSSEGAHRALERAVIFSAAASAAILEVIAAERGLQWVNERDHQSKAFQRALAGSAPLLGVELSKTRRLNWPDNWPRIGDIDIVLQSGDARAALELKCGAGKDALAACAWDAVKLATAIALQDSSTAYLVAAAPAERFTIGARGPDDIPTCAEFFTSPSTWASAEVRHSYRTWFDHWERNNDPLPIKVAATFTTRLVSQHNFVVNDTVWQQRVASVELPETSWYDWVRA